MGVLASAGHSYSQCRTEATDKEARLDDSYVLRVELSCVVRY